MLKIKNICSGTLTAPEKEKVNIKQKTAVPVTNISKKTRKRYQGKF